MFRRFPFSPAILEFLLRSHKCCLKLAGSIFLPLPFRHTNRKQLLKILSQTFQIPGPCSLVGQLHGLHFQIAAKLRVLSDLLFQGRFLLRKSRFLSGKFLQSLFQMKYTALKLLPLLIGFAFRSKLPGKCIQPPDFRFLFLRRLCFESAFGGCLGSIFKLRRIFPNLFPVPVKLFRCFHPAVADGTDYAGRGLLFLQEFFPVFIFRLMEIRFRLLISEFIQPVQEFVICLRRSKLSCKMLQLLLRRLNRRLQHLELPFLSPDQPVNGLQHALRIPHAPCIQSFPAEFTAVFAESGISFVITAVIYAHIRKILEYAPAGILSFAKAFIHVRLQPVFDLVVTGSQEHGAQDLRSLFRPGIQQMPEFSLRNHRNLPELVAVNIQQFLDHAVHFGQPFMRRIPVRIEDCGLLDRHHTAALPLRPFMLGDTVDLIMPSLMLKVKIHIAFRGRGCILAAEISGIAEASAGPSVQGKANGIKDRGLARPRIAGDQEKSMPLKTRKVNDRLPGIRPKCTHYQFNRFHGSPLPHRLPASSFPVPLR